MLLGPMDELGDDKEVARKAHIDDHVKLESQALTISIRIIAALQSLCQAYPRIRT